MPLSLQLRHQKNSAFVPHGQENSVLDTWWFMWDASQKWERHANWEVNRWKAVSLREVEVQLHCTCRVRNYVLSSQLRQTRSMHPHSEDTGRLILTQAYGHKPFAFSSMALLQALHIKKQLQKSMTVGTLQINFYWWKLRAKFVHHGGEKGHGEQF